MPTDPVEPAYQQMRDMTKPNDAVPDRRGPWVYDVSENPSLNGIDPTFKDLPGAGRDRSK